MEIKRTHRARINLALAAIGLSIVLCLLTVFFIRDVRTQLWEQSVNTIMESTSQGRSTLKIQLDRDFASMRTAAANVGGFSMESKDTLEQSLLQYSQLESGTLLYLDDGACIPASASADLGVLEALSDRNMDHGIIDPHISSVTGVNVFNLFVRARMSDGTAGFLVKEYEVNSIVDSFSLSFYNNAGFSYVINTRGDVLIRPTHPGSNKTVQNLFDMLPETENDPDTLAEFAESLTASRTGWAVFNYQGEPTVFCYTPLELQSDWYLISIIPEAVVNAQTTEIITRSMLLIGSILVGISALIIVYIWYINKTNKKLRNQANYIRHLYNAVPEAVALITVEPPHNILQLNLEGQKMLGYSPESDKDVFPGLSLGDILYSEDVDYVLGLFKEAAAGSRKSNIEYRLKNAGKGFFWVSGVVEKTLDDNGDPVLISTFRDITRDKLAKEAAARDQRQERLTLVRAISNAYPVIIRLNLTMDTLKFIYMQPGLMIGLGSQKTYSQLFEDMSATFHKDDLEVYRNRFSLENLRSVFETKRKEVFLDARQMLTDGKYHWISSQIIYVDNPYSEDQLAVLISRRVDEQRYEEEQQRQALESALDNARAASEAKGRFLSSMSHDIRTPMNAIVGMTAIASTHLDDKARVAQCLEKISLSSSHLLSLINDVLDVSKIESGKLTIREETLNLSELVADVTELIRPQADEKEQKFEIHTALDNENVIGDALRIRQVFLNILSNAVKYTPEGGQIHVTMTQERSSRRNRQSYIFCCRDTGAGMSREFMERLFEPFERAYDSTTSKIAGTGLGLAITKNLVDLMNGEIMVDSEPQKGSEFTVILPLQVQDIVPEPKISCAAVDTADYTGKKVLLVEDNEINREIVRILLGELGLQIDEAIDGEAAVRKFAGAPEGYYDLILMDIQMPKMDGYEATRAIRALRRGDALDIPIVAMTANAFEEDVRAAIRAGMNAHFAKPIESETLKRILNQYLKGIPQKMPSEEEK